MVMYGFAPRWFDWLRWGIARPFFVIAKVADAVSTIAPWELVRFRLRVFALKETLCNAPAEYSEWCGDVVQWEMSRGRDEWPVDL